MATLNTEQLQFLNHHKIDIDKTFDASGMRREFYQVLMKEQNKIIAYGVSPCAKRGHTLRTRAGHCAQCNTHVISKMKEYVEVGFVYIAGSVALQCIKVGFTSNPIDRAITVNKTKYGNSNDWQLLCKCECEEGGMIEKEVQKLLGLYRTNNKYFHDGHQQETSELFTCGYPKAIEALKRIQSEYPDHFKSILEMKYVINKYSFANRIPQRNI